jgi:predicted TIM-barrel fold metal-dependent hydrolase
MDIRAAGALNGRLLTRHFREMMMTLMSEFADVPMIDGHLHFRDASGLGEIGVLLDEVGFDAINTASLTGRSGETMAQNALGILAKLTYPGRIYACGGLHYDRPGSTKETLDLPAQVRALMDAGFDGIKMIEGKPTTQKLTGIPLDDPVYDDYYALLEAEQIPVVYHVADPARFWDPDACSESARKRGWYYGDGGFPSKAELHRQVDNFLGRFPKLRVIFAHFYFHAYSVDAARAFLDAWENVSFDLTPFGEMYLQFTPAREAWREFFIEYQDRIVLGTDLSAPGWHRDAAHVAEFVGDIRQFLEKTEPYEAFGGTVQGLGLDRPVLEKILAGNFRRIVGAKPKDINRPAARALCERLLEHVRQTDRAETMVPQVEQTLALLDA